MIDEKPNAPRVVERDEVIKTLSEQLKGETDLFLQEQLPLLRHGQKTRLLEALVLYPMEDISFKEEPELSAAIATLKRQADIKTAIGVELTIEAISKQQNANKEGGDNVSEGK